MMQHEGMASSLVYTYLVSHVFFLSLLMQSVFLDRTFRVKMGIFVSRSFPQEEGVPQEDVPVFFGVILFDLAINAMEN